MLPRARIRSLEMPPAFLRAYMAENVFDAALVPGDIQSRPASWTSEPVGEVRSGLLARPSLAKRLGPGPITVDSVRSLPFVGPTQTNAERFVASSDDCPLRPEERIIAHEMQTVGSALEFAARTEHVVFCPLLAARRYLETGILAEIPVVGWNVCEVVYVACNGDRVLSRVRAAAVRAAREALSHGG
jgi:DNA-binding transcriptional LysR family regulator